LELHDLISRKSELKQALNDATSAMEAAELAESTVEVTRRASIPQVEDPSIVESFNERNFTTEDLTYLQEQRDLLRIRIDNLTATLKESKNSPSGTILSSGSRSVSLPRILISRKALLGEVKKKISDLNQQQDELAKQQRKCLGDCQNLRRANPKAVLCKHCNLGYCRKCSQKYSITTHESSCTLALPESISLPTVGLSDDLIQVSEVIEQAEQELLAEQPSVHAHESPQTVPKPALAKSPCRYCGKTRSVSPCPRRHLRCNRCNAFCNSCSRRSRNIERRSAAGV
jgi:hypothetical protein